MKYGLVRESITDIQARDSHAASCSIKPVQSLKPNLVLSKSHLQRLRQAGSAITLRISLLEVLQCLEDVEKERLVTESLKMRFQHTKDGKSCNLYEVDKGKASENFLAELTDIESS